MFLAELAMILKGGELWVARYGEREREGVAVELNK
jgi:hypothetical protein